MIFKHEKWGDDKHYSVAATVEHNRFVVREFVNGCKKTELSLSQEEKVSFVKRLKENEWYEQGVSI